MSAATDRDNSWSDPSSWPFGLPKLIRSGGATTQISSRALQSRYQCGLPPLDFSVILTIFNMPDRDGKIEGIWRGNTWTPAEVIEEIKRHND